MSDALRHLNHLLLMVRMATPGSPPAITRESELTEALLALPEFQEDARIVARTVPNLDPRDLSMRASHDMLMRIASGRMTRFSRRYLRRALQFAATEVRRQDTGERAASSGELGWFPEPDSPGGDTSELPAVWQEFTDAEVAIWSAAVDALLHTDAADWHSRLATDSSLTGAELDALFGRFAEAIADHLSLTEQDRDFLKALVLFPRRDRGWQTAFAGTHGWSNATVTTRLARLRQQWAGLFDCSWRRTRRLDRKPTRAGEARGLGCRPAGPPDVCPCRALLCRVRHVFPPGSLERRVLLALRRGWSGRKIQHLLSLSRGRYHQLLDRLHAEYVAFIREALPPRGQPGTA